MNKVDDCIDLVMSKDQVVIYPNFMLVGVFIEKEYWDIFKMWFCPQLNYNMNGLKKAIEKISFNFFIEKEHHSKIATKIMLPIKIKPKLSLLFIYINWIWYQTFLKFILSTLQLLLIDIEICDLWNLKYSSSKRNIITLIFFQILNYVFLNWIFRLRIFHWIYFIADSYGAQTQ